MVWDQRDGESSPPPYPPMDRDTLAMVLDPCLWGIIHASTTLEASLGKVAGCYWSRPRSTLARVRRVIG